MGSVSGVLKTAAKKAEVSIGEYEELVRRGQKWCHAHRVWHPLEWFGKDSSRADGRLAVCRAGNTERKRKYLYKLSADDIAAMLVRQENCCAICRRTITNFHVDHDHNTGKVRGLLCTHCNNVLGHAHDDATVLRNAIGYLEADR